MNEMKIFRHPEFGIIRVVDMNGEPWFIGKDIVAALGYVHTPSALKVHVDKGDRKLLQRRRNATLKDSFPSRSMIIINENGLHDLIFGCKMEGAKAFGQWITDEVLPGIQNPEKRMSRPVNTDSSIQIFNNPEFGNIRTTVIDGEPWFVGKDVAAALGYSNPRDALAKHVDDEDKTDGVAFRDSIGREQKPIIINESGLYALIFGSKLESAKRFKHWVTSEVLPSIRKTGSYSIQYDDRQAALEEKKASVKAAEVWTKLAERYTGDYRQILDAYAAKELAGKFVLPLPVLERETYSATEIAARLGVSAIKVGKLANRHGLKTDEYGRWFKDKSPHSNREVQTFRYYDTVIPVLQGLIQQV